MKVSVGERQRCCVDGADPTSTLGWAIGPDRADGGWRTAAPNPFKRVHRAIELIEETLEGDLSLWQVARHVHQSKFHFARAFKRATGVTLHAYVTERRLLRARELLLRGDHSLCEIALMCGFSSQAHLTTLYKQRFGCTPGRCRERTAPVPVPVVLLRMPE